jgi:hypothetical protein
MNNLPIAVMLAADATADLARSARPDAPVVPDHEVPATGSVRRVLAVGLHRLAYRLANEHPTGVPSGVY